MFRVPLSSFAKKIIQQILDGEVPRSHISSAFVWGSSPQGHDFWCRIAHSFSTEEEMEEAKSYLRWLIREKEIEDNGD